MVKTIFKEVIITLLLCLAILLVLSILFYDYNPINKVVPSKIAYTVPENVKNELEEKTEEQTFEVENKVYTVEGSDLNIYKKSNSYNPGKANPFASSTVDTNMQENTNTATNNTTDNKVNSNNTSTNTGANNTSFLNKTGTK